MNLNEIATRAPKNLDKDAIKEETLEICERIGALQNLLYAEGKRSVLVILQGMDASGKDGTTRGLFRNCSPAGVRVFAFKKPSEEEFAHDFLWRIHKQAPEKGQIGVFNRSQYEDILIQWVHGWIDDKKRTARMKAINSFENLLSNDANTLVVKLYLHISEERQEEKLMERVEDAAKHWKHNDADWEERKLWSKYREAYQYALDESEIEWYVVPCDQEWYRDYIAAKTLLKALESLNLKFPALESELFKPNK
jgi:PPK2 family polyphosphate:nucleotide phosphotransferase